VRFDRTGSSADTPVYRRADLAAGQRIDGPAIIEERETTAVIRAGWMATVAPDGSVIAERSGGRAAPPEGSTSEESHR
jgi:N-methylhydantoinase A